MSLSNSKKGLILILIPLGYLFTLLFIKDLAMEGDLGRHIKLGEVILHCLCIPKTNLFSYTNQNFPIVNHEWLGEVVFYITTYLFGLNGLLILKMILVLATASLLYVTALKKGSIFWVTIFSLLFITIFSLRFFVLPELFSYLFIGIFVFLIERYKDSGKKYLLWFLPALEILWVNSHIYFILGIVIYGFFFLELLLKQKKVDKVLLSIGLILVISTLLNPDFIHGALLPFTFSSNYNFNVEENISPLKIFEPTSTNGNLAYTLILQIVVFEILVLLFGVCFFIKKEWRNLSQLGSGLTGAYLGLMFTRCIGLFGLLGFIPLVESFTYLEEKLQKNITKSMKNTIKGAIVILVFTIVGIHIKGLFDYQILGFNFVASAENAVSFIKQTHIHGRIFNNYIIGNYLIYGLYPQEQVFVDGRPEAYPASFFNDYWRMMKDQQFFNKEVDRYNINSIVFNVAVDDPIIIRPFLLSQIQSKNWIPVYIDGNVTILVRNNNLNTKVIDKYKIQIPGI